MGKKVGGKKKKLIQKCELKEKEGEILNKNINY